MKKILFCFLFFMLLIHLTGCTASLPVVKRSVGSQASDFVVWTADFRTDEQKNSYRIKLKTPKNTITGLCFLKKIDAEWRGTIMNEMGAKAFDFIVTDEKCELLNVVSLMDKGYIKKIVAADLYFFIHVDNPDAPFFTSLERYDQNANRVVNYRKKQVVVGNDGAIRLINRRHRLQYELRKMVELDPDKMIL